MSIDSVLVRFVAGALIGVVILTALLLRETSIEFGREHSVRQRRKAASKH